jgi:hypothetical protein
MQFPSGGRYVVNGEALYEAGRIAEHLGCNTRALRLACCGT